MNKTKKIAKGAKSNETRVIKIEEPVSTVETIGFAIPPVVADEVKRSMDVLLLIAAAVPPPAIMANDQLTNGLKSLTVAIITAVPAIAANGTAMVSNKLSTQGM